MGFNNSVFASGSGAGGGGGGGLNSCLGVTYSTLLGLSLSGSLICGQEYVIEDFQTVHLIIGVTGSSSIPFKRTGAIEPIVVTATSASTLADSAWSISNPDDVILYSLIDNTSANPGDGSSKGLITYRENIPNNLSTYYDFRNVVFYRPLSQYDLSTTVFPIITNSIEIDGVVTPFSATANTPDELATILSSQLYPVSIISFFDSTTNVLFVWSKEGLEYGDLNVTDSSPNTFDITPTFNAYLFFTFGNEIIYASTGGTPGSIVPASDGNQISSHVNIHVGETNDLWWGISQANIVFGEFSGICEIGDECVYCTIGNACGSIEMDGQNFDINIASYCNILTFALDAANIFSGTMSAHIVFGQDSGIQTRIAESGYNIFVGDGSAGIILGLINRDIRIGSQNANITCGDFCERIYIADNAQSSLGFVITIPTGTLDSVLQMGYSSFKTVINPDVNGLIDLTTPVLQYIGIIEISDASFHLKKLTGLVSLSSGETHHPVVVYTATGRSLVVEDKDTSGVDGNIYLYNIPDITLLGDNDQSATFILGRNDSSKVILTNLSQPVTT